MASRNPFLDDEFDENNAEMISPSKESTPESLPDAEGITLDQVASKLLKDRFILTALELHTEFLESGKELPRLRDFFSNPANFERTKSSELTSPGLPRSSSVQTFDSIDFARYSDDGIQVENDKVAVLEFELRKAQETIKSLRATLTKTAEPELPSPVHPELDEKTSMPDISAIEMRALNFLVNEYLLNNNYKLTSVTLAEENEDQDFESWDDVGLNVSKPPDLLHLYRDYTQHGRTTAATREVETNTEQTAVSDSVTNTTDDAVCDASVNTEGSTESGEDEEVDVGLLQLLTSLKEQLEAKVARLETEMERVTQENVELHTKISNMHTDRLRLTSTPTQSPIPAKPRPESSPVATVTPRLPGNQAGVRHAASHSAATYSRQLFSDDVESTQSNPVLDDSTDNKKPDDDGDESTVKLISPRQPEVASDGDIPRPPAGKAGLLPRERPATEGRDAAEEEDVRADDSMLVQVGSDVTRNDINLTVSTETPGAPRGEGYDSDSKPFSWQHSQRQMSSAFRAALLSSGFSVAQDSRIISEVSKITDSSGETVVLMLGRCLPHIVPNVLIAKREELIPVLLLTATLHPEPRQRDTLLNILFNLIKKPDAEQRQMILTGCVAFAQHVGPARVESELLPQCWEQIAHKYAERRLLVAEACGTLAPYVPNEIRSSLVLSMLQQMVLEDKAESVREAAVRSLATLAGFIDDPDKFSQGLSLLLASLSPPAGAGGVSGAAEASLLPALAVWAAELGRLTTELVPAILSRIAELVQSVPSALDRPRFCLLVHCLQLLVPHIFATVLASGPYADCPDDDDDHDDDDDEVQPLPVSRFPTPTSDLYDLGVILGSAKKLARLDKLYSNAVATVGKDDLTSWQQLNWVVKDFVPGLVALCGRLASFPADVVHALCELIHALCRTLGRTATRTHVAPHFSSLLTIPDDHIDQEVLSGHSPLTRVTATVYIAGVLTAYTEEDDESTLRAFLSDLLATLALCQVSLDSIKAAFTELSLSPARHDLLLAVLWDAVVHTSAHVRAAAARMFELLVGTVSEALIGARIIPALITLATDPEIAVRISTVAAFGTIIENITDRTMLDKVYMQLQSFMDEPAYRDHHQMALELIRTFARVGPNAEPRFRDEFVLPRLAVLAASNNHAAPADRKLDVALQLFEAYTALSCCFLPPQLVQEAVLPGLRCLLRDFQDVGPDHTDIVASMVRELEDKVTDTPRGQQGAPGGPEQPAVAGATDHDAKTKVFNRFRDIKDRASASTFTKMFNKK